MLVRVLGTVEAVDETTGAVVDLGRRRHREVLALLAARAGEVVPEDWLIAGLWPDGALPENPRRSLQTYVSRLRAAIGPELLPTEPPGYRLIADTDAARFERELTTQRADPNVVALRDVVDAYRGPPFGEFSDAELLRPYVRRAEDVFHGALEELAELLLASDDATDAAAVLQPLIDASPERERTAQLAMLALHRSGRHPDALRVFQAHREALADAGLAPSESMSDLERRVVARDPELDRPRGRQLGSYELFGKIGEGAFGSIYRASQPSVDREVAIKVVRPELANDPSFVRRFEVEARTVARLEHPHIVPLYDFWRDPSGAYLVMRYLSGGSAEQRLVQQGPWPLTEVGRLVDEIGAALAVAHSAGVLHRDLKPANILSDEAGNSYLADFGIAAQLGEHQVADLRSAGSPLYVSPEQVRDGEASPASDIYAFGVVLYELLTGGAPFADSDSLPILLDRKVREPVPPISDERPDIPGEVDLVIQTATAVDPARRFPSMGELVLAFRAAAAGSVDAVGTTDALAGDNPGEVRPRFEAARTLVGLELEGVNPYKGLAAFDEVDASHFYGRDDLAGELLRRVNESRFVVVTGPSGSGKSSVVRAGVLPRLREVGAFVATMVPGPYPMDELETALLHVATGATGPLLGQLTADERGLGRAVKTMLPSDGSELVLVVDQFEELFTLASRDRRDEFLAALAAATTDERSRVRVICTLRADFYDRPLQHQAISELVRVNTVAVAPLSGEELDAAITRPAAEVGVTVEPALTAELIAESTGHAAALPMLQYALTEMFERRSGGRMTVESYGEIGGLTGALANRADELYGVLGPGHATEVRRMFTRLVSPGEGTEDTRRRVARTELEGVSSQVVDAYGDARLLTFDHDPGTREPTVEIAHEALIREWPQLRSWLDDDRDGLRILRHLGSAAGAWELSAREPAELYRGGRLETAEEFAADNADDLTAVEAEFLRASVEQRSAEEAAEKARLRRLRTLLSVTAVIALLALIAGGVALQQRSQARDQRTAAERNATDAEENAAEAAAQTELARSNEADAERARFDSEIGRIAADAGVLADESSTVALLLAAEVHRMEESPRTLGALQNVLANTGPFLGRIGSGTPTSGVWWLDDDRLLGLGSTGVSVYEVESGDSRTITAAPVAHRRLRRIDSQRNEFPVAAVAANGSTLVISPASDPTTVEIHRLDGSSDVVSLEHGAQIDAVAVDAAGGRVATFDFDGVARVFDSRGELLLEVNAHPELTPDEQVLDEGIERLPLNSVALWTNQMPGFVRFLESGELMTTRGFDARVFDPSSGDMIADTGFALWTELVARVNAWWATGIAVEQMGDALLWNHESSVGTHDLLAGTRSLGWTVPDTGLLGGTLKVVATTPHRGTTDAWVLVSDGRVLRMDMTTGEVTQTIVTRVNEAAGLSLSTDGRTLAVSGLEGITLLSTDGRQLLAIAGERGLAVHPSISADGARITGSNGNLDFPMPYFDVGEERLEPFEVDFLEPLDQPSYFGDPGWPTLLRGLSVVIQDTVSLEPTLTLPVPYAWSAGAMPNDGRYFLVAQSDARNRSAELFDTGTGELVGRFPFGQRVASTASFHPDGDRLMIAFYAAPPVLLSIPGMKPMDMALDLGDIVGARWTNDGKWFATIDRTRQVHLHDPATLERIHTLQGSRLPGAQRSAVYSLAGGDVILSAVNNTPQLWDASTGRAIGGPFPTDHGLGMDGHDGLDLVVTGVGDHFLLWNLDTTTWRDIACQAAGRNLTADEWQRWGPSGEKYRATCDQWPALG